MARKNDKSAEIKEIENRVLRRIKPSKREMLRVKECVEALSKRTTEVIDIIRSEKKIRYDIMPMLVGSVAKGTYNKNPDIDMFLMFPEDANIKELRDIGLRIGHCVLQNPVELYAQHPYVRGEFMGFQVDMVPSYGVKDPKNIKSAVDRTPYHTKYVITNLNPCQRDDVRILKAFMKGIGIYGAESSVKGFSGYLCELLVIKYGSWTKVLKNASENWHYGMKLHLGNARANVPKHHFIFVDPVDPKRNVASALSIDSYAKFILAAREFLKDPNIRFFFPKARKRKSIAEINKKARTLGLEIYIIVFDFKALNVEECHDQMERTMRAIIGTLQKGCFQIPIIDFGYDYIKGKGWIVTAISSKPKVQLHKGPPVWSENAEEFIRTWTNREGMIIIRGGRLHTLKPCCTDIKEFLDCNLDPRSVGKGMIRSFATGNYKVLNITKLRRKSMDTEIYNGILMTITSMLWPKMPWEW